jgi:hypothetical protein
MLSQNSVYRSLVREYTFSEYSDLVLIIHSSRNNHPWTHFTSGYAKYRPELARAASNLDQVDGKLYQIIITKSRLVSWIPNLALLLTLFL